LYIFDKLLLLCIARQRRKQGLNLIVTYNPVHKFYISGTFYNTPDDSRYLTIDVNSSKLISLLVSTPQLAHADSTVEESMDFPLRLSKALVASETLKVSSPSLSPLLKDCWISDSDAWHILQHLHYRSTEDHLYRQHLLDSP